MLSRTPNNVIVGSVPTSSASMPTTRFSSSKKLCSAFLSSRPCSGCGSGCGGGGGCVSGSGCGGGGGCGGGCGCGGGHGGSCGGVCVCGGRHGSGGGHCKRDLPQITP